MVIAAGCLDPAQLSPAADHALHRLQTDQQATDIYRAVLTSISGEGPCPIAQFQDRATPYLEFDHVVLVAASDDSRDDEYTISEAAKNSSRLLGDVLPPADLARAASACEITTNVTTELFPSHPIPHAKPPSQMRLAHAGQSRSSDESTTTQPSPSTIAYTTIYGYSASARTAATSNIMPANMPCSASATEQTQVVIATPACWRECRGSSKASAGVRQPRSFRGRALRVAATASSSWADHRVRSVPFGKCRHRCGKPVLHRDGAVASQSGTVLLARLLAVAGLSWKMDEHREPCRPLDQRSDRGALQTNNEVAFPVAENRSVFDFDWSFADQHIIGDVVPGSSPNTLSRDPKGSSAAKTSSQFTLQRASALT